ncbi:aminotransferase class IV [Dactylosporangium roseum]|uniref:Aminotransferase class IV n=1 Tax=Dactylosporangium roseum TaxID=47989 RepID=A0ABY5ZD34_9ACTN|nr:aminotransferase class IV [Dactylosporangium roseum]UWZ40041.1 aminotransferase class IV [Dactylosporangium roseum]
MSTAVIRLEVDGREPKIEELYHPILVNYGHFTAMQVRGGRVQGLALHLDRLVAGTRELFAAELDPELVRDHLRHALRDVPDAAVRINVYRPGDLMVLVAVRPPADPAPGPVSLRSVPYQRPAAHLKHLGSFGQLYHGHAAGRDGFDDALLTGPGGEIAESAVHNVAFFDGTGVTWPSTPHLPGIMMRLLRPRLAEAGLPDRSAPVRLADLAGYRAAFVTNSVGVVPVDRVDDVHLPLDRAFMARVEAAAAAIPWDHL